MKIVFEINKKDKINLMLTFQSDSKPLAFTTGCYQMDNLSKWNISHLHVLQKKGKTLRYLKFINGF